MAVSPVLIPLCRSLDHLTRLTIRTNYSINTVIFFVDILQNLPLLESIDFWPLHIESADVNPECEEDDGVFYGKILEINRSRVKSVRLSLIVNGNGVQGCFKKSNKLLNFILLSCPDLEIFRLIVGSIQAFGTLSLDFRGNAHMKQIDLYQTNCRYYTFQHESGKCWKNINAPTSKESLTRDEANTTPYSMHLAWNNENNNTEIKISDCKW